MKAIKYKNAIVVLKDGSEITVKSPAGKLSAEYFTKHAYHYARVKKEDIRDVILITK